MRAGQVLGSLMALALLAGCAPPLPGDRPAFPFAPAWQDRPAGVPRLLDNADWWRGLQDPVLDRLIALALEGSPPLAAALARAEAARATAAAVPGALTLNAGLQAEATGASGRADRRETRADARLDLLFDPGRGKAAERAGAAARAEEAAAAAAGARLFLIGQVIETYLTLRHDQRRLALASAEAARARRTLALARQLAAAGAATRIETLRSEARLAEIESELPGRQAAVAGRLHALAVLAGRAPGALPPDLAAALGASGAQPRARLAPDPGVPADLLRNRPDIRLAEAAYDAARAELGQARAALYPRLSLSGAIEIGRAGGGRSSGYSLGPALRLPALPGDAARAGLAAGHARVAAAHAGWTEAVLTALAEVETALAEHRATAAAEAGADRAVRLHAEAVGLMRGLAGKGEATLGDLIDAEAALARAEAAQAAARLARGLAFARLNLRLGAGASGPVASGVSTAAPMVAAAAR